MSLKPDDIRRIACVLNTVAECEERAHRPLLSTLHAIVEVPEQAKRDDSPPWRDHPDRLMQQVELAGIAKGLVLVGLRQLHELPHGWCVDWHIKCAPELKRSSTTQGTPELALRAELARLTDPNTPIYA